MWASLFRRHLLTLGNNTTNRIESFNAQIKYELRKKRGLPPSLPETVSLLLELVSKKNADATYKNFRNTATVMLNATLPEMQPAGLLYSDAGFRLLQSQVVKMKERTFALHVSDSGGLAVQDVQSGKLYDLTEREADCVECCCTFSCAFYGLPCCHVLFSRRERSQPLFDTASVPDRWQRKPDFGGVSSANNDAADDWSASADQPPEIELSCDYSSAEEDSG